MVFLEEVLVLFEKIKEKNSDFIPFHSFSPVSPAGKGVNHIKWVWSYKGMQLASADQILWTWYRITFVMFPCELMWNSSVYSSVEPYVIT